MQTYLGLKPKRNPASAPTSVPGSAAIPAPAAEDAVSRAIELLHEEFFSTGTQLKHVFTAAQLYSIVSDRSAVDRELQCLVSDGSLRRFRNIGSRSGDDDFFMRSVNYVAALQSLAESTAKAGRDPSFILRYLTAISGYTSMHLDKAQLDHILLKIHKDLHSPPPPPSIKRSRRGDTFAAAFPEPAPQPESWIMQHVFDDSRLLVEHLILQPRDQHSYWISLAGAGQLPLWLLDARSKIKAGMARALYGEIAVSALPLKGAPVCSKFFVRDMLGRGDITLRHTTSALAAPPLHALSHERVTRVGQAE